RGRFDQVPGRGRVDELSVVRIGPDRPPASRRVGILDPLTVSEECEYGKRAGAGCRLARSRARATSAPERLSRIQRTSHAAETNAYLRRIDPRSCGAVGRLEWMGGRLARLRRPGLHRPAGSLRDHPGRLRARGRRGAPGEGPGLAE